MASLHENGAGGVAIICESCGWKVKGPGGCEAVAMFVMKQGSESPVH